MKQSATYLFNGFTRNRAVYEGVNYMKYKPNKLRLLRLLPVIQNKMRFLILFILLSEISYCQTLDNTVQLNSKNLYHDAIGRIMSEYADKLSDKIVILEGNSSLKVRNDFNEFTVLNSERTLIYWTKKKKLNKKYKHLINKQLVRLVCRSTYIDSGYVHIPILMAHTKYSNRKKHEGGIWQEGLWTLIYYFDPKNRSYELKSILKGIEI